MVKGYEYDRGQFVTFTPDELKALEPESTGTIDLSTFVPRADVDPLYFNTPYYVYPDGRIAVEAFQVLNAAMTEAGLAGIGRITLSRRERLALVEPRDGGMVLITLRANEEVRAANFGKADGDVDPEMVDVASGDHQAPARQLRSVNLPRQLPGGTEAANRGQAERAAAQDAAGPRTGTGHRPDDRAEAQSGAGHAAGTKPSPNRERAKDRRQTNLLLPVAGKGRATAPAATAVPTPRPKRKKA